MSFSLLANFCILGHMFGNPAILRLWVRQLLNARNVAIGALIYDILKCHLSPDLRKNGCFPLSGGKKLICE